MTKRRRKEERIGYLFASPWLIGLFAFTAYPLLSSLYYSFTNYSMSNKFKWIGLTNYKVMFTADPAVGQTLINSLIYALIMTPFGIIVGFFIGFLVHQNLRGIKLFRVIFYLPCVISSVATSMVWTWMFQKRYGIFNQALGAIGIDGPAWMTDPFWSKIALVIMSLWGAGSGMIMYLAALKSVSPSLYEAAQLDGAGAFRRFFQITIPMVSPILFYNLLTGFIGNVQIFGNAYLLIGNGNDPTRSYYVYYLYTMAMENRRMGYACAMGWILAIVVFALSMTIFKIVGTKVYYTSGDVN